MKVEIIFRSTTPWLMHNPRLADPDNEYTREIKEISGKKKKTDEDRRRIEDLEWYGGLFTDTGGKDGRLVMPTPKVRKSLINAGKIHKLGKNVERALVMSTVDTPLIYDGPRAVAELAGDGGLRSRLPVVVGGRRIIRCRPQFHPAGLVAAATFAEDAGLNFDELQNVAKLAGVAEGIGDNRANGYGRFRAHVREVNGRGYKPLEPTVAALDRFFESLGRGDRAD
jgi:hypothetical protein